MRFRLIQRDKEAKCMYQFVALNDVHEVEFEEHLKRLGDIGNHS